jgi:hypothetical protein
MDHQCTCPFKGNTTSLSQATAQDTLMPVLLHAYFFSHTNGMLTDQSMTEGHSKQSIFAGVVVKIRAILNLLFDRGMEPTPHNVSRINNPASTGIWDSEGRYNETRFNQLCEFGITLNGKKIILKEHFHALLAAVHGDKYLGIATYVYWLIPVHWWRVTDGSINELYLYYNDCWVLRNGKIEPAFTDAHLKLFYTNPNKVMQMRIDGELPAKKDAVYKLD